MSKAGRPFHVPDAKSRLLVESLIGCGFRFDDVAKMVGIDPKTLRKHYETEVETGHLVANSKVAQALFLKATEGEGPASVTACIFWLKARANWVDKQVIQVSERTVARIPPPHQTVDEWLAECLLQPDPTKVH